MKKIVLLTGFAWLSAFVLYRCSTSVTERAAPAPVAVATPGNSLGKKLFDEKCALCHGKDGTAGIGGAANLQTSTLDSLSVIKMILQGKDAMPPFKDQLGTGEIEHIASYARSLRQ